MTSKVMLTDSWVARDNCGDDFVFIPSGTPVKILRAWDNFLFVETLDDKMFSFQVHAHEVGVKEK